MRYYTHLLFTIFIILLLLKYIPIESKLIFIIVALFFTLLPDIDESHSKMGRRVKLISIFLKHRGFFHSIWIPTILLVIFIPISRELGFAILVGYLSHLFADALTKEGVAFLFPLKFRLKGPFKTGGLSEKILFMFLLVSILIMAI